MLSAIFERFLPQILKVRLMAAMVLVSFPEQQVLQVRLKAKNNLICSSNITNFLSLIASMENCTRHKTLRAFSTAIAKATPSSLCLDQFSIFLFSSTLVFHYPRFSSLHYPSLIINMKRSFSKTLPNMNKYGSI